MYLHRWLTSLLGIYAQYAWMFHGVIIFLVATLFYWLQRKIIKRLLSYFEKTTHVWDDSFLVALSLPLAVMIWIFAATLFGQYFLFDLHQDDWARVIIKTRITFLIILFAWFVWRYIAQIETRLTHPDFKRDVDITTVSVVGRFARIALIFIGVLMLLEGFGIPLSGVLAFGGGGAIVMGIAAQQLLANWFGGLMIFLDKPFKLGDWIQSPDRQIEGVVSRIGWRTTKLMSLDNRPFYVPNSLFNEVVIVNPQRMTHRRIDVVIGIRYDDAPLLRSIIKAIETMLKQHPNIDHRQNIMVHLVNFGASSLEINIYCFTRTTQNPYWRDVQQDVFFKVIDIVTEHKAQFAFPTVTTHIPEGILIKKPGEIDS